MCLLSNVFVHQYLNHIEVYLHKQALALPKPCNPLKTRSIDAQYDGQRGTAMQPSSSILVYDNKFIIAISEMKIRLAFAYMHLSESILKGGDLNTQGRDTSKDGSMKFIIVTWASDRLYSDF